MVFHLEFVLSAEALISVLRSNFKNIGLGAKKIEKGEFVIQDSSTKIDVDLTKPWETCFRPGQHADMSMVFKSKEAWNMSCPKCRDENSDNFAKDEDIECRKCKMVYRRSMSIIRMDSPRNIPEAERSSDVAMIFSPKPESARDARAKKRNAPHDEENEMALFRRVRIKTEVKVRNPTTPPSRSRNSSPPGAPLHPGWNRMKNRSTSSSTTASFQEAALSPPPDPPPQNPQHLDDPGTANTGSPHMFTEDFPFENDGSPISPNWNYLDSPMLYATEGGQWSATTLIAPHQTQQTPTINNSMDFQPNIPWNSQFAPDSNFQLDANAGGVAFEPKHLDDPYAEIQRRLREEREREFQLPEPTEDSNTYLDMDRDNEIDPDAEDAFNEMEHEERLEAYADDWEVHSELMREAAVDREINDRMLRDELPESEFSDDQSEFLSEDESEED